MSGRKHTIESKIKMSNNTKGRIITQECRNKIADATGTKVTIDGITYRSIREAARTLNKTRNFIKTQCQRSAQSNNRPN